MIEENNQLTGSIFTEINQMRNLQEISLCEYFKALVCGAITTFYLTKISCIFTKAGNKLSKTIPPNFHLNTNLNLIDLGKEIVHK